MGQNLINHNMARILANVKKKPVQQEELILKNQKIKLWILTININME
jgi:hypothetical protein